MIIAKNRELLIPVSERYVGTAYDDNSTVRIFRVSRVNEDGVDRSNLDFYVILNYDDGSDPAAFGVVKSVTDEYIILEWDVSEDVTRHSDHFYLWVRGFDYTGTIRWSSYPGVFYVADSGMEPTGLSDLEERISEEDRLLRLAKLYKSQPMTAATVADMKDRERIYVYVGTEPGHTYGNWYFWNGSAWVSGGVYNARAYQTDKSLTASDIAADAKAVGDRLAAETSERTRANASLQAQINEFTALENGSTTGDAELTNTRVTYDGTTYDNAGTAVRNQVSDLWGDVANLYDQSETTSQYSWAAGSVNTNNGAYNTDNLYRVVNTVLLPAYPGMTIRTLAGYKFNVFLFGANRAFISGGTYGYTQYTVTNESVAYIRIAIGFASNTDMTNYVDSAVENLVISYNPVGGPVEIEIFDKNNYNSSRLYVVSNDARYLVQPATDYRMVYLPCEPNTEYTVKKSTSTIMRVVTSPSAPVVNGAWTNFNGMPAASTNALVITSGPNDHYLAVQLWVDGTESSLKNLDAHTGSLSITYKNRNPLCKQVQEHAETLEKLTTESKRKYTYRWNYLLDQIFSSATNYTTVIADIKNDTPSQYHARMRALCGTASGYAAYTRLGTDNDGNELYSYVLTPNTPQIDCSRDEEAGREFDGTPLDYPTFIVTATLHGTEASNSFAIYNLLNNLINHRSGNPALEFIFRNVRLVLIPACCPSGWIADSYENSSGVNLNRDFPTVKTGTPSSPEVRLIKAVIDQYASSAVAMFDLHTHITYDIMSFNYSNEAEFKNIITRMTNDLTLDWIDAYPNVEFDTVNGSHDMYTKEWCYNARNVAGTSSYYISTVYGVPAGTIESRRRLPILNVRHAADAVAFSYDVLINSIISFCAYIR